MTASRRVGRLSVSNEASFDLHDNSPAVQSGCFDVVSIGRQIDM